MAAAVTLGNLQFIVLKLKDSPLSPTLPIPRSPVLRSLLAGKQVSSWYHAWIEDVSCGWVEADEQAFSLLSFGLILCSLPRSAEMTVAADLRPTFTCANLCCNTAVTSYISLGFLMGLLLTTRAWAALLTFPPVSPIHSPIPPFVPSSSWYLEEELSSILPSHPP